MKSPTVAIRGRIAEEGDVGGRGPTVVRLLGP